MNGRESSRHLPYLHNSRITAFFCHQFRCLTRGTAKLNFAHMFNMTVYTMTMTHSFKTWCVVMLLCICYVSGSSQQIWVFGGKSVVFQGNISISFPSNTTHIVKPDYLPTAKVGGHIDLMVVSKQPFEPNRTFTVTINSVEWLFLGPKIKFIRIEESSNHRINVLESDGETFFLFRINTTQDMSNATLKITHRIGIFGQRYCIFKDTISFVPKTTGDNMHWSLRSVMGAIVGILFACIIFVGVGVIVRIYKRPSHKTHIRCIYTNQASLIL